MNDLIAGLRARGGLKWNAHPPDVLAAWVAEMDFGLAPAVGESLHAAVDRGDTGYPYPQAERDMAEAAVGFWSERLGWEVDADRVFPAPDVVEGIRRAIVHLTRAESPVVLHTPIYFPFFSMVERAGRDLIEVPCQRDSEGRYRLDLEAIEEGLAAGAGSLVLCSPWNPTGRSFSREEIDEVAKLAASYGSRVIADEVHAPLTYPEGTHEAAASRHPETAITVTSASKAWNLPGLKCAQVVLSNDEDIDIWADCFTPEKVGVGTFGLVANAAAYSRGREWLGDVLGRLQGNRALFEELVTSSLPEALYTSPEATYLAWLDMRPYGVEDPASVFLERGRVAVTSGEPFGIGGAGHIRFNFATDPEIIVEAVARMASVVKT